MWRRSGSRWLRRNRPPGRPCSTAVARSAWRRINRACGRSRGTSAGAGCGSLSRSRLRRSSNACAIASPVAAMAAAGSRCAPPTGSLMISSITPKRSMSCAVIFMLVAASCALRGIAPQDRRRAFRRDHAVDRMLQHQHAARGGDGDRAARPAFADDDRDVRHAELQAGVGRARNRLGLAAFLGADAGIGAGGIDQRQHRNVEAVGHFHQPHGLAIAFRPRHAEIVLQAALRWSRPFPGRSRRRSRRGSGRSRRRSPRRRRTCGRRRAA